MVPVASCGFCGSTSGHYTDGENVFIFGRNGGRESTVFDYHCVDCSAVSGPTTAALYVKPGEPPRHVVSIHIADADVFLQQRKPRQRHDEQVGFSRALLEEFTDHAATHKTFEAFVLTYNRTMVYAAKKKEEPVPRRLDIDSFRHAWFLCMAFEKGMKLGVPPQSTLVFTKANICGNGPFEFFLEELNGPLGSAFTDRFAPHSEE